MWCWGRDIERPEGNVLLERGMRRFRSPDPEGGTLYKALLEGDVGIWLWGFGLLCREPSTAGVFLRRYDFDPLLVDRLPDQPVHLPADLGPLVRPTPTSWATVQRLVQRAARWIANYERWVADNLGVAYRQAVLEAFDTPPTVPATAMASSWEWLADESFRLYATPGVIGPWARLLSSLWMGSRTLASSLDVRPPGRRPFQNEVQHRSRGGERWPEVIRKRAAT
ncbi:MAG: hypothetical protein NZ700_14655 [Gemmataceae bacterium]|nr:hypothetical protein [Gemmataceae bacterium]MDW8266527.1 hypothetical protein [Gemmataceae bacterium]